MIKLLKSNEEYENNLKQYTKKRWNISISTIYNYND